MRLACIRGAGSLSRQRTGGISLPRADRQKPPLPGKRLSVLPQAAAMAVCMPLSRPPLSRTDPLQRSRQRV